MRLNPGLSSKDAYAMLSVAATLAWGVTAAASLEPHLLAIAEAMEVIGNLDVPDDTDPLFGDDEADSLAGGSA